jgi:CBS domain-containing protein
VTDEEEKKILGIVTSTDIVAYVGEISGRRRKILFLDVQPLQRMTRITLRLIGSDIAKEFLGII